MPAALGDDSHRLGGGTVPVPLHLAGDRTVRRSGCRPVGFAALFGQELEGVQATDTTPDTDSPDGETSPPDMSVSRRDTLVLSLIFEGVSGKGQGLHRRC